MLQRLYHAIIPSSLTEWCGRNTVPVLDACRRRLDAFALWFSSESLLLINRDVVVVVCEWQRSCLCYGNDRETLRISLGLRSIGGHFHHLWTIPHRNFCAVFRISVAATHIGVINAVVKDAVHCFSSLVITAQISDRDEKTKLPPIERSNSSSSSRLDYCNVLCPDDRWSARVLSHARYLGLQCTHLTE